MCHTLFVSIFFFKKSDSLHFFFKLITFNSNLEIHQQKELWILFYTFWKIPMGTPAAKISVKLLSANITFVNCLGLDFPQILRTQKSFLGVFHKSSCSALIKALMKYLHLISSGSKLKSVTCKFTKGCTLSQLFFKEFHYKCRTLISKNAS